MAKTNEAISPLEFLEWHGFSIPTTATFFLDFFAETLFPISAYIEVKKEEHFYLVKALAENKGIRGYEEKTDDLISFYMQDQRLTFVFRF